MKAKCTQQPSRRCRSWWPLALASCLPGIVGRELYGATVEIHVFDFDFSANPGGQPIVDPTINVGDTVRWSFDEGTHSTTAAVGQAKSWNSGVLTAPATFEHTFTVLGTFNYFCIPHGADLGGGQVTGMSGSITVVPEPAVNQLLLAGLGLGGFGLWWRQRKAWLQAR